MNNAGEWEDFRRERADAMTTSEEQIRKNNTYSMPFAL